MRDDMFHVVIDRPRTGGDGGKSIPGKGYKKQWSKVPIEELPIKEGIAKPYLKTYNGGKSLNEHLKPLYRYLEKQVGRPWNKVFSEVCENISQNSATQSHVRDHVFQHVERNVVMHGRKPMVCGGSRRWYGLHDGDLYVNPRTGLLCKHKERKVERKPKDHGLVLVDPGHGYKLCEDIWYEVWFSEFDMIQVWNEYFKRYDLRPDGGYDVLQKRVVRVSDARRLYGVDRYVAAKRQLNGRQIKKLKLRERKAS